jgi:hypothetical protein
MVPVSTGTADHRRFRAANATLARKPAPPDDVMRYTPAEKLKLAFAFVQLYR